MSYQDKLGRKGEEAIINYLLAAGYDVQDVSADPEYWAKDTDILATKDGKTTSIEVKNDQHISKTGNAFIENSQDIDGGQAGWFLITKADKLYYRDDINSIAYVIDMDDLREYIEARKQTLPQRKARPNAAGKVAQGYLVQISDLEAFYPVSKIHA